MRRFNLKRWIYSLFEKAENKKPKKSDELAQPKGMSSSSSDTSNNNSKRNANIRKIALIVFFSLIGVSALILIIVFATRKSNIELSQPTISYQTNENLSKRLAFTDASKDNKGEYFVNFSNNKTPLLAAYYTIVANGDKISVKIQSENSLPLEFSVLKETFGYQGIIKYTFSQDSWIITNLYNNILEARLLVDGKLETVSFTNNPNHVTAPKALALTKGNELVTKDNGVTSAPIPSQAGWYTPPTIKLSPENQTNLKLMLNNLSSTFASAYAVGTNPKAGFNWYALISILIPFILFGIIIWISSAAMKKQMGGADSLFGMGKTNIKPAKTKVRFTDVAGIDEVETELREIVDYVKNPKKYAVMGARAPKGILLYGPPGTGKTLIAKAVAGEANCSFYAMSGSAFEDMLVGVGAKRVRDLFQRARKDAPSIIFIDEIDAVASKRGKNDILGGGGGIADQTINQLLTELDGFSTDAGVVVIGATNRLDSLDEAILRPGRFDRQIQVTLPDIRGREAILKIHSRNKNLSTTVDLKDIARRTAGFSGAQLENVMNEATLLAVRNNKTVVTTEDIDEGIDRTIGGPARKGRIISEEERRQIAYHEAGHALIGLHAKNTDVVEKITIIPRGNAAGYTMQTPAAQEMTIQKKKDLLNQVRMTLGGRAAEEVIFGKDNITTGAANDLYKVSQIVRAMVLQMGMTSEMGLTQYVPSEGQQPYQKLYSEQTAREIDRTIEKIIQEEYEKAKQIIINNRYELELIVKTLLVLETILKKQIDFIHTNLRLPPEVTKESLLAYEEKKQKQEEESKNKPKEDKSDEQTDDSDSNNDDNSSEINPDNNNKTPNNN